MTKMMREISPTLYTRPYGVQCEVPHLVLLHCMDHPQRHTHHRRLGCTYTSRMYMTALGPVGIIVGLVVLTIVRYVVVAEAFSSSRIPKIYCHYRWQKCFINFTNSVSISREIN